MKARTFSLVILVFFLPAGRTILAQSNSLDSLLFVLGNAAEDSGKVNILNLLSEKAGWKMGNMDTALYYATKAAELAERLNYKSGLAKAYSHKGTACSRKGNLQEALQNHLASLKIKEECGDKRGTAYSLNNIGLVYDTRGNYAEAQKSYLAALKVWEEIDDKRGAASSRMGLGNIYVAQVNYEDALKNYLAALKIKEDARDNSGIAAATMGIANVQYLQADYEGALKSLRRVLTLNKASGDKRYEAYAYNNIGNICKKQGEIALAGNKKTEAKEKFLSAIENYHRSLKISEESGDKHGMAGAYGNLGDMELLIGNLQAARQWMDKSLRLALETGLKQTAFLTYGSLARADSASGNFKGALQNYKLSIAYRDSLINEENTKKTVQQQMQYEFDKKSAADSIKNLEAKRIEEINHQSQIRSQKLYTYIGLAGFLIMIVIAAISFAAFKNKKKANVEIAKQKELVEAKQKEILDSIKYARRIQRALITNEKYISKKLAQLKK